MLSNNIDLIVNYIKLQGMLFEKIQNGELEDLNLDRKKDALKLILHLDALSKIMMLLETFFTLIQALSTGNYKNVLSKLTKYNSNDINRL